MAAAAAGAEQQKSVTLRIKIPQNKLIDNLWVAIDSVCGFMHWILACSVNKQAIKFFLWPTPCNSSNNIFFRRKLFICCVFSDTPLRHCSNFYRFFICIGINLNEIALNWVKSASNSNTMSSMEQNNYLRCLCLLNVNWEKERKSADRKIGHCDFQPFEPQTRNLSLNVCLNTLYLSVKPIHFGRWESIFTIFARDSLKITFKTSLK